MTYETVQKLMEKEGASMLYIALSWEDYLALGDNMQRLKAYIKADNALLCYYREDLNEMMCGEVKNDAGNPIESPTNGSGAQ